MDVACNDFAFPHARFHAELRRLVEAGFAARTMYGSDQMYCPDAIGQGIGAIEDAPFLTAGGKRHILYGNAARFLRLTPARVAAGHAPSAD